MCIYIHIIHNHYSSVEIPFDGQIVIFWLIKFWRSYSPLLGLLTVAFYFPMRNSSFGESMGHFPFFFATPQANPSKVICSSTSLASSCGFRCHPCAVSW